MIRPVQKLMRELVHKKARFFLAASLAALGLRLLLVVRFPGIVDDSRLYANIAENWLLHGIYGITNSGIITPTLSRLPGYPAFLAILFALFGDENYRAVLLVQVLIDLATCFLIADMARRLFSARAAQTAFLLAALCPFLANYAAAALTETLEIFFTALALRLDLCRPPHWQNGHTIRSSDHRLAGLRTLCRRRHPSSPRRWHPTGSHRRISFVAARPQLADRERIIAPKLPNDILGRRPVSGRSRRALSSLDTSKPAHIPSLPAACPALCQRL